MKPHDRGSRTKFVGAPHRLRNPRVVAQLNPTVRVDCLCASRPVCARGPAWRLMGIIFCTVWDIPIARWSSMCHAPCSSRRRDLRLDKKSMQLDAGPLQIGHDLRAIDRAVGGHRDWPTQLEDPLPRQRSTARHWAIRIWPRRRDRADMTRPRLRLLLRTDRSHRPVRSVIRRNLVAGPPRQFQQGEAGHLCRCDRQRRGRAPAAAW